MNYYHERYIIKCWVVKKFLKENSCLWTEKYYIIVEYSK